MVYNICGFGFGFYPASRHTLITMVFKHDFGYEALYSRVYYIYIYIYHIYNTISIYIIIYIL